MRVKQIVKNYNRVLTIAGSDSGGGAEYKLILKVFPPVLALQALQ